MDDAIEVRSGGRICQDFSDLKKVDVYPLRLWATVDRKTL